MQGFTYRRNNVLISPTADIPTDLRTRGDNAHLVQVALNSLPPWRGGEEPSHTVALDTPLEAMVTEIRSGDLIIWGVHVGHKAKNPGFSPFVLRAPHAEENGFITIQLEGSPARPVLTRAYGGQYAPPLPWMYTARHSSRVDQEQGREFWRTHAYASEYGGLVQRGSRTYRAPWWFR